MRGKDLLECMEQIDDALVEEALEPAAFPRRGFFVPWMRDSAARGKNRTAKWGMAAACVIVLGISATAFWSQQNMKDMRIGHQDIDSGSSQMAMDTAVSNDSGSADSTAAADAQTDMTAGTQTGTVADGSAGGSEGSAASGGAEDIGQSSAGHTAPNRQKDVEKAKSKVESEENKDEIAELESLSYTVISDYYGEKDDSVYDYPVPEKGKFFCYHYLQETMKYYAALENASEITDSSVNISATADSPIYVYDVVIDMYGETEENGEVIRYELGFSDRGTEEIEQEYRRLIDLGYAVRLSEDFQLTGTFTKVELDTFQASPEYGYTFRFASEY